MHCYFAAGVGRALLEELCGGGGGVVVVDDVARQARVVQHVVVRAVLRVPLVVAVLPRHLQQQQQQVMSCAGKGQAKRPVWVSLTSGRIHNGP